MTTYSELCKRLEVKSMWVWEFKNMIEIYEFESFNACWKEFKTKYPEVFFPKEYAEHIWNEEMCKEVDKQDA